MNWSPEHDVFCSLDGKNKSYARPSVSRETCCSFTNSRNAHRRSTAASGISIPAPNLLAWPDARFRSGRLDRSFLSVTISHPISSYSQTAQLEISRTLPVEAGRAFSPTGKARRNWRGCRDFEKFRPPPACHHQLRQWMVGLYRSLPQTQFDDVSTPRGWWPSKTLPSALAASSPISISTAGSTLSLPMATLTTPSQHSRQRGLTAQPSAILF